MFLKDGTTLQNGKYRIVRRIKSGGFGCTYEAVFAQFNKRVAIKEFFPNKMCGRDSHSNQISVGIQSNQSMVDRLRSKFIDEAAAVYDMRHENIVRVTDFFEENGTAYYVMEYINGESLSDALKRFDHIPEKTALNYIRQIADALAYVHRLNRLHLDIKPGNIMVDGDNRAVLIDFGASKHYDGDSGENTSTLIGVNTPGYAPVEQSTQGFTTFSPATDIYALGATFYKLLTGITPPEASCLISEEEELKPLSLSISLGTRMAIAAAMQPKRKNRPQSIAEFLSILNGTSKPKEEETVIDSRDWDSEEATVITPMEEPKQVKALEKPVSPTPKEKHASQQTNVKPIDQIKPIEPPQTAINPVSEPKPNPNPDPVPDKRKLMFVAGGCLLACVILFMIFKPSGGGESDGGGNDTTETVAEEMVESISLTPSAEAGTAVDLGLSVKWADRNIGAGAPEKRGEHFMWGDTARNAACVKDKCATFGKQINDFAGNVANDAATAHWGGKWRMPTSAELVELRDKCDWKWTTRNGVKGYVVKSKANGNSIFLPAAGFKLGDKVDDTSSYGGYWGASPYKDSDNGANYLDLTSSLVSWSWTDRHYGLSIRPVTK